MTGNGIVCLSYGAGQDSTALLVLLAEDKDFRERYVPKGRDLFVVWADTQDEHPETYEHVERTIDYCRKKGIRFEALTKDRGYHRGSWSNGLIGFYEQKTCIGSKAYPKTCSWNLKIEVIAAFFEDVLAKEYGIADRARKSALKSFATEVAPIDMMLGIARGEERRCAATPALSLFGDNLPPVPARTSRSPLRRGTKRGKAPTSERKWLAQSYNRRYPLIDLGVDRQGAQRIIRERSSLPVPIPSNCYSCPFKRDSEILLSARQDPNRFEHWCSLEQAKRDKWASRIPPEQNYGVDGRTLLSLPQVLGRAKKTHGHLSTSELLVDRNTRGHGTTTRF